MKSRIKRCEPAEPLIGSIVIVLIFLVSCTKNQPAPTTFKPTQSGFGVVVKEIGVDVGPGAALYYKGTNTTPVLVWPTIGTAGYPILYTNDIALMLADKPNAAGETGTSAIIAVQGTGPAMDISNDILRLATEQKNVDFKRALRVSKPIRLTSSEQGIHVLFYSKKYVDPSIPDLDVMVTWERVLMTMVDVRNSGVTNKVTNTDVPYLEKNYAR